MTNIVSAIWNHFSHIFNSQRPRRRENRQVHYSISRRRRTATEDENLAKRLQEFEDSEYARILQREEDGKEQLARASIEDSSTIQDNENVEMILDNARRIRELRYYHENTIDHGSSQPEEHNLLPVTFADHYSREQLYRNQHRMPYEGHRLHQSLYDIRDDHLTLMMDGIDSTLQQMEPCLRAWSLSDLDNPPLQSDSILHNGPRPYDTHSSHYINTNEVSPLDDFFIYDELYPVLREDGDSPVINNCTICLNGIDQTENDNIKCLPCMHVFHEQCIDQWLNENDSCPVCRVPTLN